ncbi:MAG: LysR family transcriptional regulator [Alphaproteobacteria bacterium]|nr:LysR family transcriptional regulator [Alphaproteobacteria bacterium]
MSTAEGFEELVTVVEEGSLTAAARALGLPRPTLSRRLARLEERLGVRLVHRTTRRLSVTPAGEALYAKARLVVQVAREAEAEARRVDDVPRGLLRVSVPTGAPQQVLARWLVGFLDAYPEVQVEVVASSAHVDLVGEGFDVALRAGPVEDTSLIAHPLVRNERIAVASPAYLQARGTPCRPEDLRDHDCIVGYRAGIAPETHWPACGGGSIPVHGRLCTNQMEVRLHAAIQGQGIAMVFARLAAAALADGRLTQVLPDQLRHPERVSLVYRERAFLEPKIRAFVDHLSEAVRVSRAGR